MATNLVIVESPAKWKTIKKYLWSDYEVIASMWHMVDLPKKGMGIDIQNDFKPQYEVTLDRKKALSEIKKLASKASKVWIATDEDREWEAIGRHIANQLWLNIQTTPRIVFHEITKKAIENAVANPRYIDTNLVDAQQARRILDRLVWFELSPVLWTKVSRGLSAGRVQSVAVRLIVEKEREIETFKSSNFFKTVANFIGQSKQDFNATLNVDLANIDLIRDFLENCKDAQFTVSNIDVKPGQKYPSAPFTTSTLQQEASRKLWFSVSRTMQLAQKLYEAWHISYMRTDSVNLSQDAISSAQSEIIKQYGKEYSKPTTYKSKTKWAQEAHECIRPTHMENMTAWDDSSQKKLYDLIRKRTIASQMSPAKVEKTKVEIDISNSKHKFIAEWEVILFPGFLKVYMESSDDDNSEETSTILPKLEKWEILGLNQILSTERFKKHPPRYTEASLVKELEKKWIGRPSTYAPTISTIQKRWYAVLESRSWEKVDYSELLLKNNNITQQTKSQNTWVEKNKLFPTDIWRTVTDFLTENFQNIMDYNFTASIEEQFDVIASWELIWTKMLHDFYWPFHTEVAKSEWVERSVGERNLWKDPKTWKDIIVRIGRYWPLVQLWLADDPDKKFANVPSNKTIETITLEEALDCFKLPREVGEYEWETITSAVGRFGPYVKFKNLFVSIPKNAEYDPMTISLTQAVELVKAKLELESQKNINKFKYDWKNIEVLNGPYGPYIKYDKKNYKIPKWGKDATDLTLEDCLEIIQKQK